MYFMESKRIHEQENGQGDKERTKSPILMRVSLLNQINELPYEIDTHNSFFVLASTKTGSRESSEVMTRLANTLFSCKSWLWKLNISLRKRCKQSPKNKPRKWKQSLAD